MMTSNGTMETFFTSVSRSAQLLHKVGGDTGLLHPLGHQAVGHLVVDDALADDGFRRAVVLAVASSL